MVKSLFVLSLFLIGIFSLPMCSGQTYGEAEKNADSLQEDTLLLNSAYRYRQVLLDSFNDTHPIHTPSNYYHLIYYSSFSFGKSIRFEKKDSTYFLCVTTLNPPDSSIRRNYQEYKINKHDWEFLEFMINDFGFWSAPKAKGRKVLDGHYSFFEGNVLNSKGKQQRVIARRGLPYDKMEAMCNNVYEFHLGLIVSYSQITE